MVSFEAEQLASCSGADTSVTRFLSAIPKDLHQIHCFRSQFSVPKLRVTRVAYGGIPTVKSAKAHPALILVRGFPSELRELVPRHQASRNL